MIVLAAGRAIEQSLELLSVTILSTGDIYVFPFDPPVLRRGEGPKLAELILVVLFIRRDSRVDQVDRNVHTSSIQTRSGFSLL
jgi:hypothetical protein